MRRSLVALFAVLFAFTLLAAAPSPSILGTPVLLVYPFSVNGSDVSKEAGSRLAVAIATEIANLGGVDVKPAPPGIERPNYLDAARTAGADYYIAGYVTPLGDGVSVVEQLVSALTGIVVYSNTAQVRTYADAAGQGDVLRDALLRHQTRNLGAYAAPPPPAAAPSPTPAPGPTNQATLGGLFSHKKKSAAASASPAPSSQATASAVARTATPPTPAAAPAAAASGPAAPATHLPVPAPGPPASPAAVAAAPPGRGTGYGLLTIGGPAEDDRRSFTGAAIRNDMLANHRSVANADGSREEVCGKNSVSTVLGGNLTTRYHTVLGQPQTMATLELLAYDCAGNVVYRRTFAHDARGDWKNAVDGVVATAVAAFLREPIGNPHS